MTNIPSIRTRPLPITYTERDPRRTAFIAFAVQLFDHIGFAALLEPYEDSTIYDMLIRVSPREILQEKTGGVSDRAKENLLKKLHKMWWEKNGCMYEYQRSSDQEETA